jgi:P-type conjugative transfer protein TrbJ
MRLSNQSKRAVSMALTYLLCLALVPTPPAQAGVLGGFATEWTQIANNVQLVSSYIRMGEQLRQEILMVTDMTKQGNILPSQVFGTVMADIARLHSVVQTGRALAYSMANLDAEFKNRFSGYGYVGNNWYLKYRDWSQTSLDSSLGALKAANLQASQMNSEEAVLQQLRTMSQSADGRMKAIEVGNQINDQMVEQMMKLRQIMLADLQGKEAFQAAQIQKDASNAAATEQFFKSTLAPGDPRKF